MKVSKMVRPSGLGDVTGVVVVPAICCSWVAKGNVRPGGRWAVAEQAEALHLGYLLVGLVVNQDYV